MSCSLAIISFAVETFNGENKFNTAARNILFLDFCHTHLPPVCDIACIQVICVCLYTGDMCLPVYNVQALVHQGCTWNPFLCSIKQLQVHCCISTLTYCTWDASFTPGLLLSVKFAGTNLYTILGGGMWHYCSKCAIPENIHTSPIEGIFF